MTNDEIIDAVLKYEGGFVNDPADHGGATNFGITAADLGRWRKLGRAATVDEVKSMRVAEARQIFQAWYITAPGFEAIADSFLKWVIVDSGVLHGTRTAIKWLQQALGVTPDGVIGSQTTNALNQADMEHLARSVLSQRIRRYVGIVKNEPSQLRFLQGVDRTRHLNSANCLTEDYVNDLVAMIAPVSSNMAKALTGPAAALALRLLGRAVLGDEDASPETIADALKNEDPDVRLKIARAEADFQRQAGDVQIELVRLANQNFADARQALIQMETVAANDRANARQRQQITNDRTNAYLAYIVTISFVLVILLVIRLQIGGNDTPVLNTLLGVLGTGWASIMTFYFGSSVGSREKTAVLGEATIQSKNVGVGSPTGLEGTQDGAR